MTVDESIGVLGLGNMGTALLKGMIDRGQEPDSVNVYDVDPNRLEDVTSELGVHGVDSASELNQSSGIVIVCVKPKDIEEALESLGDDSLNVISIAAGVSISEIRSHVPDDSNIIRVMPNTPAQVQEGMSFLAPGEKVGRKLLEKAEQIFQSVGEVSVVDESKMDAVTALSGSGPAYVFYLIEAMYEAGVYMGLDHEEALLAAEQTLKGASRLARDSEESPANLRGNVSSPGGTTVEAIKHLEEEGIKGSFMEAIKKARDKSIEL